MNTPSAINRAMPARRTPASTLSLTALGLVLALPAHARDRDPTNPDQLAWRLFVAINRSVGCARSDAGAAVAWETWANTLTIYREDGEDPGPWRSKRCLAGTSDSGVADETRFEGAANASPELVALTNVKHIVAGRMVPGIASGIDAQRLIESRMNRVAYDYVRSLGLYNLDGQVRVVAAGRALQFPRGSIEVKASWRPIEVSDASPYRTLRVHLRDGETRLYGLTALNLAAKILPAGAHDAPHRSAWLWASFEHVDNAHRALGEGWQLPSHDTYACPEAQSGCDRAPEGLGLAAAVWQNYRLRGTLTDYVDGAGRPQRLANSELEAGLQPTSSCITCHARSALAVIGGRPSRLPVFTTNERRGSIGIPESRWFRTDGAVYRSLDFVWSLAQAKPRRSAALAKPDRHELPAENFGDMR